MTVPGFRAQEVVEPLIALAQSQFSKIAQPSVSNFLMAWRPGGESEIHLVDRDRGAAASAK
jgi:hypothetical protein